jgi:KaiC/GvpD/RAD55 family RecA-like ATPase
MDVEQLFLSKVIRTKDIATAASLIRLEYFHDPLHMEIWIYLLDYWQDYSECPSPEMVRMEHPEWVYEKSPDALEAYADLLSDNHKRHATIEVAMDTNELLRDEDIDGALARMSSGVMEITQSTVRTDDEDEIVNWKTRIEKWKYYVSDPNTLVGIPTGFPFIDLITGGMQPEQFHVLIGLPKAGKSSIAIKIAKSANDAGKSVVYMSYEMSNEEQGARLDGMVAGFNPNKLLRGTATPKELDTLARALKAREDNEALWFIHDMGARTLSGMMSKVYQYKPDLLIVDGMYLMDAEIPGVEPNDWRALTKISRQCKRLAQTLKIPVFGTTQASASKTDKGGLRQTSVMFTQAFGQDCDGMMGIEEPEDGVSIIRVIMGRNFGRSAASITFDWDRGLIEEKEPWSGEGEDEVDNNGFVKKTGTYD